MRHCARKNSLVQPKPRVGAGTRSYKAKRTPSRTIPLKANQAFSHQLPLPIGWDSPPEV